MQKQLLISLLTASALLVGCGGTEDSRAVEVVYPTNPDGSPISGVLTADFDPSVGIVPTPNNLVYAGSTDGTLNIPVTNPANFGDPLVAINTLDGWSTVAPMITTFSAGVNPATIVPGQTVRVFRVTLSGVGGGVTSISAELTPGAQFVAFINPGDATQRQLVIMPTQPLLAKSHYVVLITNGVTDNSGNVATPSTIYGITKRVGPLVDGAGNSTDPLLPNANAVALEPLRQLTNAAELNLAATTGLARSSMVLTWTVSTQSVTDVIDFVAANVAPAANNFAPTGLTTAAVGGAGAANIWFGYIDLPYGLQSPADGGANSPARVLGGYWTGAGGSNLTRFNPAVVWRSTQRVPAILTTPAGTPMPVAGYPVVIFLHGITGNRTQALGMADAAAMAGFAVVSIDQPLHGLTSSSGPTGPLYAGNPAGVHATPGFAATERTFDVDLVNNTTGAPGPDGVIDGAGTHTINLASLLTARDNLRQAQADLLTVRATIGSINTVVPGVTFDSSNVHFVGHSLGAIVGTGMLGATNNVASATMGMPGGGIARLLDASVSFGPRIRAGLAAAGVTSPSPAYDQFMFAAQTVIDSADPINHAIRAAANSPVYMISVVGDGGTSLPDQVVPNNVATAPLSGTDPLARMMGLTSVSQTTVNAAGVRGIVRFTAGDHGSLLSPAASAAAFLEMQRQTASFIGSSGTAIQVTNAAVVQQP